MTKIKVVGIDWDSKGIRGLKLRQFYEPQRPFKVEKLGEVVGDCSRPEGFVSQLRRLLLRLEYNPKKEALVVVMGGKNTQVLEWHGPVPPELNRSWAVQKFQSEFLFPLEDAWMDFQVLPGTGGKGIRIVLGAAAKEKWERYRRLLEAAEARVRIVDILPLSIANALYHQSPERVDSQLVIHLSSDYATLVVLGTHPLYSRYIPLGRGPESPDFGLLDRELLQSLAFIEREYPGVSMGGFHLMGNHPGLENFAGHLEGSSGQGWETIDLLKAYGPGLGQPKGKYELALSLALRDGRLPFRN